MDVDIDLSVLEIQDNDQKPDDSVNLPILQIQDNDKKRSHSEVSGSSNKDEIASVRRSSRKKIRPVEPLENRRVLTRPRKLNVNSSMKEIENYYLDKKVKISSPALETIFEEPKKGILMSARRLRRCINFSDIVNEKPDKCKVRKRSMKAKKLSTFKKLGKKITLEFLMDKLKTLDNDKS